MQPAVRYAQSGDHQIAYQVIGEGPDLVFVPGWISNLELMWENPPLARFLRRLMSFTRLILIDKRGTGLSDRLPQNAVPTLEDRMDDVRAVMDDAGSARAALLGVSEGGALDILFAATHPERTTALILFGTFARVLAAPDYPCGIDPALFDEHVARVEAEWGTGHVLHLLAPSLAGDERALANFGRLQRLSASPGAGAALLRLSSAIDVRHVLPAIRVPTLVLHRDEQFVPLENGRYLAEHIPGARFVALKDTDHLYYAGDVDPVLDEFQEFLTGVRHGAEPDRVLATVLFTDIVGSTERAAALGDRRWRDLLESHHGAVRAQLVRFRGREVRTVGDGFLATFDGPARAIQCGRAIVDAVHALGLDVRVGLHTGECTLSADDVTGIAVHVAARVAARAAAGEVLVSGTVKDLVAGSGLRFADRGIEVLKGVPGDWRLFAVEP